MQETLETIPNDEFDKTIQQYIGWAANWDGALPADVFFGVWADFQREKKPLALKAQIVQGQLKFFAVLDQSIKVMNNSIYLEDGRELIIQIEPVLA